MIIRYFAIIVIISCSLRLNAQIKIDDFIGTYECTRYGTGGIVQRYLNVSKIGNNDTVFDLKDPNMGGFEIYGATLRQDSTIYTQGVNTFGHFYHQDSIYFQFYMHYSYGDVWYFYYGRNLNVAIDDNPKFPEPIDFIHNPALNSIQIINNLNTCEIQCDLFTIDGSKLVSQSIYSSPGETNTLLTGHLPGGVYILRLSGGGYVRTGKIVFQ